MPVHQHHAPSLLYKAKEKVNYKDKQQLTLP